MASWQADTLHAVIVERAMSSRWLSNAHLPAGAEAGSAVMVGAGTPVSGLLELSRRDLVAAAGDHDAGDQAWVRWPDGTNDIVPGSRVELGAGAGPLAGAPH